MEQKREWLRFTKTCAGCLGLGLLLWVLQRVFLEDPISYLVPGVFFLAACYVVMGYEQQGRDPVLKAGRYGAAVLFFGFSIWLSLPEHKEVLLKWEPFSDTALERAKKEKKPVLIDFTASWCGPCHVLEQKVFTSPEVAGEAKRFVLLRVDMSEQEAPATLAYGRRFRVEGYPTVLFFDGAGAESQELRVEEVVGPNDFLARMKKVK